LSKPLIMKKNFTREWNKMNTVFNTELPEVEPKVTIFVYGSLKKGKHNHRLLVNQEFVEDGVTSSSYPLVDFGAYPALLKEQPNIPSLPVKGEIYKVDAKGLQDLDWLESNGRLYNREEIGITSDSGSTVKAWVYFFMRPTRAVNEPNVNNNNQYEF